MMTTDLTNGSLLGPHRDFESIKKVDDEGVEYWEARELMPLLGYSKWENFESVIAKAKSACTKSSQSVENHFPEVGKMVDIDSGSKRKVLDSTSYLGMSATSQRRMEMLNPLSLSHKPTLQSKPGIVRACR